MELQLDHYELLAERIVPVLIEEYDKNPFGDVLVGQAIDILRNWDYQMEKEGVAPTIWYYWFKTYRDYIWLDEWEHYGIRTNYTWGHNSLNKWQPPVEYTEYITREVPDLPWFDNISTTEIVENRTHVIQKSFIDAINKLKEEMGENVEEWTWGKINKLYVEHMAGIAEFSKGPYPLSGGFDTVNSWGIGTFGGGQGGV